MRTIWIILILLIIVLAGIGYYYCSTPQQVTQKDIDSQVDKVLENELEESLISTSTSDLETELSQLS